VSPVEWRSGPDFAEYAEALEVNTSQIIMASVDRPVAIVFFTPAVNGDPPVFRAELERDAEGLLVVKGAPAEIPFDLGGGGA
jgi:hypothetical protein